jgi:disulfide bond formation protein DsbB
VPATLIYPDAVANTFALASLLGLALLCLGLLALGARLLGAPGPWEALRRTLDGNELACILTVGAFATGGSLYFSEVAHFVPCQLCWFQRIAMYPIALSALVALVRGDRGVAPYLLAPSVLGFAISAYHYQLEWFPEQSALCTAAGAVPCTLVWFRVFGFVSLPFLAGVAFALIAALAALAWHNERRERRWEAGR